MSKEEFVARCKVISAEIDKLCDAAKALDGVTAHCKMALLDASIGAGRAAVYAQAELLGLTIEELLKK
jgi:hypothetical protein